jgi:vitamin B12 transporter
MYTVIGTLIQKNSADYQGGKQTNQNDFFGNVVMKFTDQVRVNFGTRWNIHSNYGSHFTYSINPSMQTFETDNSSLKFQAAYSTAFIAPSLYQLFDPYSGNIDLKPEENSSFEIGLVYKLNEWNLSSTYFNRIESPTLIYDLATYRYENANDKARYFGAEVTLSGSVGANFSLDHQMTFTETRDGDLRYLPNFSSQTRLSYLFSKTWNVSLSTQIIGSRFGLDNTTVLDAYQLINFSVVHQFDTIPLQLFVHGTNLFNEDYIEIEGYATRGRNLVAGFRYLFR